MECKHGETNGGKAKKIALKLFLSHRITWLDKKMLLKCAFLNNLPIKRSSLANNLKQSGKTAIESHEFSDGDENYPYLPFAYEYGFSSWQLENVKAKYRIEKINNSALDFLPMKIASLIVLRNIRQAVYCLISFSHGTTFSLIRFPTQNLPIDN